MRVGESVVELMQYTPAGKPLADHKASDIGTSHICFRIQDIEGLYGRLSKSGALIHCSPQKVGNSRVIYFRDPDGIILEAMEGEPPV